MRNLFWLAPLLFAAACGDQEQEPLVGQDNELIEIEGVAVLGAFEGEWFKICPGETGLTCDIRSLEEMCALELSETARETMSEFLAPHGLESEGAAALVVSGMGKKREGESYGHLGMNSCAIEFERIETMEMTEHPFAPPPAP